MSVIRTRAGNLAEGDVVSFGPEGTRVVQSVEPFAGHDAARVTFTDGTVKPVNTGSMVVVVVSDVMLALLRSVADFLNDDPDPDREPECDAVRAALRYLS